MSDWRIRMGWRDVCFLHWRIAADVLRPTLPAGVELDLYDGSAWISIVPFRMTDIRQRGLPRLPGFAQVPEINVRTYVRADQHAGVWFYSLDAAGRLAVEGARVIMALPYFNAAIAASVDEGTYQYRSERRDRRAPDGRFAASWRTAGESMQAQPGSVEAFLHERYRLVVHRSGRRCIADVMHAPWSLQPIDVTIIENTIATIAGVALNDRPDLAYFAPSLAVKASGLRRLPAVRPRSLQ